MCDTRLSIYLHVFCVFRDSLISRRRSSIGSWAFDVCVWLCKKSHSWRVTSHTTVCFATVRVCLTKNLIIVALVLNYISKPACSYRSHHCCINLKQFTMPHRGLKLRTFCQYPSLVQQAFPTLSPVKDNENFNQMKLRWMAVELVSATRLVFLKVLLP